MVEDQEMVEFVMSQCAMATRGENANHADDMQAWGHRQALHGDAPNFPWEAMPADQTSRLYAASLSLPDAPGGAESLQQMTPLADAGVDGVAAAIFPHVFASDLHQYSVGEPSVVLHDMAEGDQRDMGTGGHGGDSGSEGSDQGEDDDGGDGRTAGKAGGKRHQCKNLMAERKRRKKLNDRLYKLRSLVPIITKMDRASILGDAIDYIVDLQKQVKVLQDELEEPSDGGDAGRGGKGSNHNSNCQGDTPLGGGLVMVSQGLVLEHDGSPNSFGIAAAAASNGKPVAADTKRSREQASNHDEKGHEMEPQVEVKQVEGNEFFLQVLCEQKPGGFVRLMEAMNSLGLEVTNVNVTTYKTLVLNVFQVVRRDNEVVQVDRVRDSLLEVTREPYGVWSERVDVKADYINGPTDYQHHQQQQHLGSYHQHLHYLN